MVALNSFFNYNCFENLPVHIENQQQDHRQLLYKISQVKKTYTKAKFMADLMAGIIVGIVALPLAIAFGIA